LLIFQNPQKRNRPPGFPLRSPYIRKDSPLYVYSKFPEKKPLQIPFSEPHRNRRSVPRTVLYLSLVVPGERPPTGSPSGPYRERCSSPGPTIHTSQNSQKRNSLQVPPRGPKETDAHYQGLLHISFIKSSKGSLLSGGPLRAPIERDAPYPKHTFTYLWNAGENSPLPGSRNGAPMERDATP
jgi:hypothetical protein